MAAAFVRDGDTIFIDDGPGITSVIDALIARRDLSDVTVHTESVPVVVSFFGHDNRFAVVVPPGTLSPSLRVIPEAEDQAIDADLSLIGCCGITLDGLLARTASGSAASRRAVLAGRRVVAVVSPGPGGEVPARHLICSLDRVDACITAERLADETARPLRAKGLKIFTAS
jgi:DeoR/GlpR family transcriptional regulator of sugar metabolism